ncbi:spindle pole body-associated protein sad1 [Pseudohyphozyma bogoriensis]|nr:spindle pole body-associated protein sad1 [Pseudohyphozyma bogoriensis]
MGGVAGGPSASSIGRATEPAQVRYGRMKQRSRDTGSPFPPPRNANKPVSSSSASGGAGASSSGVQNTSVNIAVAFKAAVRDENGRVIIGREGRREEVEEDEMEEEEDDGKKETVMGQGHEGKKRKKRTSKDPTFKPSAEDELLDSEEELGDELARGKAKRPRKAGVDEEDEEEDDEVVLAGSSTKKSPTARRKFGDATYRPGKTSEAEADESSEYSDDAGRKRKKKGKGRASGGGGLSQAIPIGRRDSDVWMGKKRKGRKGRRSVDGFGSGSGDGDDMGGYDYDPSQDNYNSQDDATPAPATSFFLRPKSPSPSAPIFSSPGPRGPGAFSPDPAFAAFDRSLGQNTSNDDSGVRGSSYDYSEEERIVAALEAQKKAATNGVGTSGAGLRQRNRIPGPPVQAPFLDGIREEPEEEGEGSVGRKVGEVLKPLWTLVWKAWKEVRNPLLDWGKIFRVGIAALAVLLLLISALSRPAPPPPTTVGHSVFDYIPFFSSSSKSTYSTPSAPVDSLPELVNRLSMLEKAMGQLSTVSESERSKAEKDRKLVHKITDQVLDLENAFETEKKRSTKAIATLESTGAKDSSDLSKDVKGVKKDLEALVARVKYLGEEHVADQAELRQLQNGVQSVGKEIASLGTKVAQVAKDVQNGIDAERIATIALEAIEARLPSNLAVQLDEDGQLEIDPRFWKHLKDAFAEKNEVAELVDDKVEREMAKRPVSDGKGSAPPAPIVKQPTWKEFLAANEASLKSLINLDISSRTGSDAIVTKKTFVDMLRRELKQLKLDFEAKSNENVEKIGQELLAKVAKQEQMKKEKEKDSLASHLNPFHRSSDTSQVTIKTGDGVNVSELIAQVVDSALVKYSKDVLARPDFALFSSGGRVIPSLTSPTYEARPIGFASNALAWLTGAASTPGLPPVTALHHDNSLGRCWPFAGSHGQLAILLSRQIVPSHITIEHASVDVSLDGDVSSAPKEFEVWGVVEEVDDVAKLGEYRVQEAAERKKAYESGAPLEDEPAMSLPPTPNHILLAAGAYDTSASSPIQTFPVTAAARQLRIPVSVVIVKILSNHGDSHYTCLYRVRVSGISVGQVAREEAAAVAP